MANQLKTPKVLLAEQELLGFVRVHSCNQVARRASSAKVTVEPTAPKLLQAEQELCSFAREEEQAMCRATSAKVGIEAA